MDAEPSVRYGEQADAAHQAIRGGPNPTPFRSPPPGAPLTRQKVDLWMNARYLWTRVVKSLPRGLACRHSSRRVGTPGASVARALTT